MIGATLRSVAAFLAVVGPYPSFAVSAEKEPPGQLEEIVYAEVDGRRLSLDLHMPTADRPLPTVIWVHGGAWRSGSRQDVPAIELTRHGYAIASVDYRLSVDSQFPAQVHDIKAAIRYLRANAASYGLDAERFAIAGSSAGGHLAALVGVTGGNAALEGDVGRDHEASSRVRAIASFYGASNLGTILSQSTPHGLSVRMPALQLLLGGQPDQTVQLARLASPVAHVDADDPPLMLIHGDQDPQMPFEQSSELRQTYREAGLEVEFVTIEGGRHGGAVFFTDERIAEVARFFDRHMQGPPGCQ